MKIQKLFLFIPIMFYLTCKNHEAKNYSVATKDSANISVFISMLYPKEHLVVKVNGNILIEQIGSDSVGNPTRYLYFNYPDTIREITVNSFSQGNPILHKTFKDTLVSVNQRSIIISRPFPKGMTDKTYKPYGYVPISSSERSITLVDDHEYYKGTFTY